MRNLILCGDVREKLREIPDETVHCVVTSPPYWGLRDYGTAQWEGGDAGCDHSLPRRRTYGPEDAKESVVPSVRPGDPGNRLCGKCGARRIDSQIGLEATPEAFVESMVAVMREVRRVLRKDGTLWLNLGDSYAGSGKGPSNSLSQAVWDTQPNRNGAQARSGAPTEWVSVPSGLKPKDLVGIPWRVAFALQADGWWLRSDVIWSKPNPMPESVTDRPTKSHEYLFLLSKNQRYYYDAYAVRENVHSLSSNSANSGVLSEAQSQHLQLDLQSLLDPQSDRVAGATGLDGKGTADERSLPAQRARTREAQGLESFREAADLSRNLPQEPEWQGDTDPGEQLSGRQEPDETLLRISEGKSSVAAEVPQASHVDGAGERDSRGVGGDQDGLSQPLRVLSATTAAHDGSRDSVEQGRSTREGEPSSSVPSMQQQARKQDGHGRRHAGFNGRWDEAEDAGVAPDGRNLRSVWQIATQPYAEAHFATFPEDLVKPCILAGTSEHGCCAECGAPWERVTKAEYVKSPVHGSGSVVGRHYETGANGWDGAGLPRVNKEITTLGWRPTCKHEASVVPCIVLDPFLGSGTTALVAKNAGRDYIGIELNADYVAMAERRICVEQERLL